MTNRITIIDGKELVKISELRNKYRNSSFGGTHTRSLTLSRESQKIARSIVSSTSTMVSIYNRIVNESDLIVPPYKIIRQIHQELTDFAAEEGYELTDEIDTAIYNRVQTAVKGFIIQSNAIPHFLEVSDDLIILTNESMDVNGKVDFIAVRFSTQMAYFIHVTTLDERNRSIKEKKHKSSNGNSGEHCWLLYSATEEDCDASFLINELAFFKRKYINQSLNAWRDDKNKGIRIDDMDFKREFLKHKGEWKLYKSKELHEDYENEVEELITFLED